MANQKITDLKSQLTKSLLIGKVSNSQLMTGVDKENTYKGNNSKFGASEVRSNKFSSGLAPTDIGALSNMRKTEEFTQQTLRQRNSDLRNEIEQTEVSTGLTPDGETRNQNQVTEDQHEVRQALHEVL